MPDPVRRVSNFDAVAPGMLGKIQRYVRRFDQVLGAGEQRKPAMPPLKVQVNCLSPA